MFYVIVISLDCLNQIIRCQKKSTSLSAAKVLIDLCL
nr:MAG TPA: hypothetical protein [Bacteriophage sp.]